VPDEVIMRTPAEKDTPDWWKAGDAVMLLAYSAIVLWIIPYHEKWADEAQAWLIARALTLKSIWFHELRYEGTPASMQASQKRPDSRRSIQYAANATATVSTVPKMPIPNRPKTE
jgi:hypothetical protein